MFVRIIKVVIYIPIWIVLTVLQAICLLASAFSAVFLRVIAFFMYIGLFIIFIAKVMPVSEILCQAGVATFLLLTPEIAVFLSLGVTYIKAGISELLVW